MQKEIEQAVNLLLQKFNELNAQQSARKLNSDNDPKQAKKPNLSWLAALCKGVVFTVIDKAIEGIKSPALKDLAGCALVEVKVLADVFTDKDSDNLAQLERIYTHNWAERAEEWLQVIKGLIIAFMPESSAKQTILSIIDKAISNIGLI